VVDASVDYRDLTSEYKFNEGSEEERASLLRANTWATNAGVFDKGDGVRRFCLELQLVWHFVCYSNRISIRDY